MVYCRMNVCASDRGVATNEVIEGSEVWEDIAERFPNCCFVGGECNRLGSLVFSVFSQTHVSWLIAILMHVGG